MLYKCYIGAMDNAYALIAYIIGSRDLPDRSAAQKTLLDTFSTASQGLTLTSAPHATVGDEFQAVAADILSALTLTLRMHLLLPDGLALRFGIGIGTINEIQPSTPENIQDGSAWWNAREAIDHAHALQDSGRDFVRTWLRSTDTSEKDSHPREYEGLVNSFLLFRDHAIADLQPRQRRITAALLMGTTQVEIARAEKMSQQAVSLFARGNAAAFLEAQELLTTFDSRDSRPPRTRKTSSQ